MNRRHVRKRSHRRKTRAIHALLRLAASTQNYFQVLGPRNGQPADAFIVLATTISAEGATAAQAVRTLDKKIRDFCKRVLSNEYTFED